MLSRFITNTVFILFLVLISQSVFAYPPMIVSDDNKSEKAEISLDIGNHDQKIGFESEVLVGDLPPL